MKHVFEFFFTFSKFKYSSYQICLTTTECFEVLYQFCPKLRVVVLVITGIIFYAYHMINPPVCVKSLIKIALLMLRYIFWKTTLLMVILISMSFPIYCFRKQNIRHTIILWSRWQVTFIYLQYWKESILFAIKRMA